MPTKQVCVRCRHERTDFEDGIKTCNRCRADKARYQKTPKGRAVHNKAKYKWRKTRHGQELFKAHLKVYGAVKRGVLQKQPCEVCSDSKAQAHHDDYNKPLDVKWLCVFHHRELHNARLG